MEGKKPNKMAKVSLPWVQTHSNGVYSRFLPPRESDTSPVRRAWAWACVWPNGAALAPTFLAHNNGQRDAGWRFCL